MKTAQIVKMQAALDGLNKTTGEMLEVMKKLSLTTQKVEKDIEKTTKKAEQATTVFGRLAEKARDGNTTFAKVRRLLYGFFPFDFFRGFNKIVSLLEQTDVIIRKFPGLKKFGGTKNLFSKLAPSKDDLKRIDMYTSNIRGAQKAQKTYLDRASKSTDADEIRGLGRKLAGRQKAEKTMRIRRRSAAAKAITGMDMPVTFEQLTKLLNPKTLFGKASDRTRRSKEGAKNFIKKFDKSSIGNVMKLIKKFVVKAAIVFLGVIFKVLGIIILAYLAFKAFGPSLLEGIKAAWEAIKVVGKIALAGLMVVFDGVKDVFNAFFGGGDLEMLIDGLLKILGGLLLFSLGVAVTLLSAAFMLVGTLIVDVIKRGWEWLTTGWTDLAASFKKIITLIAIVVGGIIFFLSMTWIAAIVAAVVGGLIYYIGTKFGKLFGAKSAGGPVTAPMTLVGERGPELVSLPRGSTVRTAQDTKRVMGGGGGNTFNITINARDTSNAELRRIADEIGRMVNSKVNRSVSSRTLG